MKYILIEKSTFLSLGKSSAKLHEWPERVPEQFFFNEKSILQIHLNLNIKMYYKDLNIV